MIPGQRRSRFSIQAYLGHGGFGVVHRALDLATGRTVAIKTLRGENRTEEGQEALGREYAVHSRLKHPNLLEALDLGLDPVQGPYLILEHFSGKPFQCIASELSYEAGLDAIVQLCRVLNYLHSRGLAHGDLKPENVLIATDTPPSPESVLATATVKLLDLGLATQLRHPQSLPLGGTPAYLAPEILAGLPADHRADLFSLGLLILEAYGICGSTSQQLQNGIEPDQLPSVRLLPQALRSVVGQLLRRDPSRRIPNAADVIELISIESRLAFPIETLGGLRSSLSSIPVVGRQIELKEILTAFTDFASRTDVQAYFAPSVFLIHGEAGVGKSRLAKEATEILKSQGTGIIRGACPVQSASPFHPFQSLLGKEAGLESLPQGSHDINGDVSDSFARSHFLRFERLEAVASEIAAAPALKGKILFIEDLHLADDETFEVFLRLVTRAKAAKYSILATFRTEGLLAARLQALIESGLTTGVVRALHVARLTLQETEEVVRSLVGPHRDVGGVGRAAHKVTDGNPLFLIELLRELLDTQAIRGGPFRWQIDLTAVARAGRSASLQDHVSHRLAELCGPDLEILAWLSTFGVPSGAALLHEASGVPYPELHHCLTSLERSGVLSRESTAGGEVYRFAHDLLRQCVYESLPAHRRAALHRSVGVAIERLQGPSLADSSTVLAFHFLSAADSVKGPRYGLEAARHAEGRGATHQAIYWYHSSLNLITNDELDRRYEVLEKLASLLRQAGDPRRAETSYLEILLAARIRGDALREAIALTQLGKLHCDRGNLGEAKAFAERALPVHRSLNASAREAETLLVLSTTAHKSGDYIRALDLARQASRLAEAVDSRLLLGLAANAVGVAHTSLRRYDEALEAFQAWLRIAEESSDILGTTLALSNIGWVHLERGLLDVADQFFNRCRGAGREKGMVHPAICASINSGEIARLRGCFGDSRIRLQEGLLASQRAERTDALQYVFYSLGLVEMELGALGESFANLNRALVLSEKIGTNAATAQTLVGLGEFESAIGHWPAASTAFRSAAEGGQRAADDAIWSTALSGLAESEVMPRVSSLIRPLAVHGQSAERGFPPGITRPDSAIEELSVVSSGHGSSGDVPAKRSVPAQLSACDDDSITLVNRAYALANGIGSRQTMVRADLAGALVYLAKGEIVTSLERSERGATLAHECGMRPDWARALLYRGMAHSAAGQIKEAEKALCEARSLSDEIDLAPVRARSRAELMALAEGQADEPAADQLAAEAADLLNSMARSIPAVERRQCFLGVPWRQAVLQRHESALRAARQASVLSFSPTGVTRGAPSDRATPDDDTTDATTASSSDESGGGSISSDESKQLHPTDAAQRTSRPPIPPRSTPPPPDDSTAPRDLRSTLALLLEESHRSVGADRGMVFLIAPDGSSEIVVARGLEAESIEDARSYCRSVIDRAAQGEEILVIDTARDERFRDRHSVGLFHIVSIICLPLRVGTKVMGALYLDSRAGGRLLREDDLRAARAMAARMNGSIRAAWDQERQREEALLRQKALCQTYRLDAIIGDSAVMRKTYRVLEAVIASDCNVLVMGESGTGKELAARAIHFSGRRKMSPFVTVDCGALPDTLVESELFGYRRGAFTGADADKRGLFEEADGGTLFLDEITNTSTLFQSKLLRVLQAGELRRVGDTTPRKVDVRIIAATNADLEETIRAGKFREDLFYRLNVVTVTMPPLREREEDIPALAEQFARAFCEKEKIAYRGVGDSALKAVTSHPWPGNVRELKNAIESALILSRDGAVRRDYLPESIRGGSFEEIRGLLHDGAPPSAGPDGDGAGSSAPGPRGASASPEGWLTEDELHKVNQLEERARILDALGRAEGDKSLAASILGCSRMTLYRRMRKLGIEYSAGQETPADAT